jgi:hypothetical protein
MGDITDNVRSDNPVARPYTMGNNRWDNNNHESADNSRENVCLKLGFPIADCMDSSGGNADNDGEGPAFHED